MFGGVTTAFSVGFWASRAVNTGIVSAQSARARVPWVTQSDDLGAIDTLE